MLRADEIECRISRISEKGLSLLLYKTARTDANLLDETVGPENWENDFKVVDGVLYGGIGIYNASTGAWNWKWDAGTESNTEAEKGRASDAFKRAGFKHGIGRELYTAPDIRIYAKDCTIKENGKDRSGNPRYACFDQFTVSKIRYDEEGNITGLAVVNEKTGACVFSYGVGKEPAKPEKARQEATQGPQSGPDGQLYCAECGNPINAIMQGGNEYSPAQVAGRSLKKHGKQLCWDCQVKHEMSGS